MALRFCKTLLTTMMWGWLLSLSLMSCASGKSPQSLSNRELQELHQFALQHLDCIQPRSIRQGVEYCGLLGYNINGQLAATPARRGQEDSCQPRNEPPGFTILASYHTHGSYTMEADTEVPSESDLLGDIEEQVYGYVATPSGRVWFNDWQARTATMLWDKNTIFSDPTFRDCPAFMPGYRYTLRELIRRADEDPGRC